MDETTALALAARLGDQLAMASLVRATERDVWRLCAHVAGRDLADDLSQEVYLRAWRALPEFRADAGARSWLLGIARHVAIDEVRASVRRRKLQDVLRSDPPESVRAGDRIEVDELLQGLDNDRRVAFVLTQVLDLSYEEAATVCRCAVGTIRSRVYRARAELVANLAVHAADT